MQQIFCFPQTNSKNVSSNSELVTILKAWLKKRVLHSLLLQELNLACFVWSAEKLATYLAIVSVIELVEIAKYNKNIS